MRAQKKLENLFWTDYSPLQVRDDLAAAHKAAWQRIGDAGTWFDGVTRVAIAAEARLASQCALCKQRKLSISPYAICGEHDSLGFLPGRLVEPIHRVVTDPGRLTWQWFQAVLASGASDTEYVELVGVVATVIAIDMFHRTLGLPRFDLPSPRPGEPGRRRPATAHLRGESWLPMIHPDDLEGEVETEEERRLAQYWNGARNKPPRALSLVPDEAYAWFRLVEAQYLPLGVMRDPERDYRSLSRPQIELIASRVSVLNGCSFCAPIHVRFLRDCASARGQICDLEVVRCARGDGNISWGRLLLDFTDAATAGDEERLSPIRSDLRSSVGADAVVDAAAVIAAFSGVNRVVSSTGVRGRPQQRMGRRF